MGLFDDVTSHYKPLGEEFTGVYLQTKSLDCAMQKYWISPAGELFRLEWRDSMKMLTCEIEESTGGVIFPFRWVPTGEHKKLTPVYYTGGIHMYPGSHEGDWESWPGVTLLLKHGKIIHYEFTHK